MVNNSIPQVHAHWGIMRCYRFLLILVALLVPAKQSHGQSSPYWLVGGIKLTVGESQADVLRKLSSLYRVNYEAQFWFVVRCPKSSGILAGLNFENDRLKSIMAEVTTECGSTNDQVTNRADAAVLLLMQTLAKVKALHGQDCVSYGAGNGKSVYFQCGPQTSVAIRPDGAGGKWSLTVNVSDR